MALAATLRPPFCEITSAGRVLLWWRRTDRPSASRGLPHIPPSRPAARSMRRAPEPGRQGATSVWPAALVLRTYLRRATHTYACEPPSVSQDRAREARLPPAPRRSRQTKGRAARGPADPDKPESPLPSPSSPLSHPEGRREKGREFERVTSTRARARTRGHPTPTIAQTDTGHAGTPILTTRAHI